MQTLIVAKSVARTREAASRVYREIVGSAPRTSRETKDSWRFRRFPPEQCRLGTHGSAVIKPGVVAVYCERG
jgi:hypothetical protein